MDVRKICTVVAAILFVACTSAFADDFNPPPYRGLQLSYTCEWDTFSHFTDPLGFYPDTESNVDDNDPATFFYQGLGSGGLGNTHLDLSPSVPANPTGWAVVPSGADFGLTDLVTPGGNTFAAQVANWVDWWPLKHLRVQVAYTDPSGNNPPVITGVSGFTVAAPLGSGPQGSATSETLGGLVGGVYNDPLYPNYFYEDWVIMPNPDWEQVRFFLPQGTIVDQIVIDTISLPEPAGLGLVGLALLAVRKRRR